MTMNCRNPPNAVRHSAVEMRDEARGREPRKRTCDRARCRLYRSEERNPVRDDLCAPSAAAFRARSNEQPHNPHRCRPLDLPAHPDLHHCEHQPVAVGVPENRLDSSGHLRRREVEVDTPSKKLLVS
jgi:hypothetical protein